VLGFLGRLVVGTIWVPSPALLREPRARGGADVRSPVQRRRRRRQDGSRGAGWYEFRWTAASVSASAPRAEAPACASPSDG